MVTALVSLWLARIPQGVTVHNSFLVVVQVPVFIRMSCMLLICVQVPATLRETLGGDTPVALVPFFLHPSRFPALLMAVYNVATAYLADEDLFSRYIGKSTSKLYAAAAREAKRVSRPAPASAVHSTAQFQPASAAAHSGNGTSVQHEDHPVSSRTAVHVGKFERLCAADAVAAAVASAAPRSRWFLPRPAWVQSCTESSAACLSIANAIVPVPDMTASADNGLSRGMLLLQFLSCLAYSGFPKPLWLCLLCRHACRRGCYSA